MTTRIYKNNCDNTYESILGKICCIMGNVDNTGSITEQIGPIELYTNWRFYQIGTNQPDPKIQYSNQIENKIWLNWPTG